MPAPAEFWQLLVRSRLVEPPAAQALHAEHAALPPGAAGDGSAKAIAAWLVGRGVLTRWQAQRLAAGDAGPFYLGDYRLLERHDRAGDGLLFSARHEPSGRTVALLLLSAKRCRELDVWTDIVRRTTAATRAADPMLSRTWSLEQHDGRRFIVCEHVAGATVADEVERLGPLPPQQAGVLAWQIARAVAEVHAHGVVHGGLSLDALRREPPAAGGARTGRVRLLQFPLATDPHVVPLRPAVATEAEVASLGRRAAFVAPELLVPGAECDPRSDVYAIGAIFHALLAGRPPHWNGDPRATLAKASFSGPDPLPPQVPAEIAAVVGALLACDPARRTPTAGEAADAIAACLGLAVPSAAVSAPAVTATPGAVPPAVPQRRSEPGPILGAGDLPRVDPAGTAGPRSPATRASVARRRPLRLIAGGIAAAVVAGAVGFVASRFDFGAARATGRSAPPRRAAERRAGDQARTPSPGPVVERQSEAAVPESPASATAAQPGAGATPSAAVSAPASTAERSRQVVIDDDTLPWASPTSGRPPALAYLPPGSQLILLARLGEIAGDDEGRLFLRSLGPAVEAAVARLVALCGGDVAAIEFVQAGWQVGGPDEVIGGYAVRFVEGRTAPADEAARSEAWGETTAVEMGGETVHHTPTLALWMPAAMHGRVLVIAPRTTVPQEVAFGSAGDRQAGGEPLIARIIDETAALAGEGGDAGAGGAALQAALPRDLETLVGMLDVDRHLTLLGSPHTLVGAGWTPLAGPLGRLAGPIDDLFGESLQAAALSLHFGGSFFVELDAIAALDVPPARLATEIAGRVDGLAARVERYCTALDPDPYGRVLVLRLPAMIRALAGQVRSGSERRGVVLNAYLPRHAGHNLALAAELALAQAPGAAVQSGPAAAPPSGGRGALARLEKRMTLAFAKDTLERAIQMVAEETGVSIEILGGDLQLEGITKNQSFGLDENAKPADEILRVILTKANPDGKLVYVVQDKDGAERVAITTRAAAEKRGDALPPAFTTKKE